MEKVKLGVIGTGKIGRMHINNLVNSLPDVEVVAVADPFVDVSSDFLNEMEIPSNMRFKDYNDLLEIEEIKAVVIASSTDTHAEISIAAANKNKAIFCEKPVDSDPEVIRKVQKVVEESGVVFQTGYNRRFDHNFKKVRDEVSSGTIGEPHIIKITSRDPAPPSMDYVKVSGGLFKDMMIHDFDLIRYLSGSEPIEITAKGAVLIDPAIGEAGDIDTAVVTILFENGALGIIDNSRQAVYGYDQRVEVFGSKGMVKAENDKPTTVEISTEDYVTTDKIPYFYLDRYGQAYLDQFHYFIEAVKGTGPLLVNVIDGLKSVEMADAAKLSLDKGTTIKL
ncbi:MAG: inositol 2-dehydrogenase [Bacillota bacterium]|nr:inositol 2-dehydrogenase [Bacillota bacterium]